MEKEATKELFRITINNFSEYIQKVNKVRPKPYIEGKCRLPIRYSGDEYEWRNLKYFGKNIRARYHKEAGKDNWLISNNKLANKPKKIKVNGQEIYNQHGGAFNRAFIRNTLHDFFKPYLKDIEPIKDVDRYPLYIFMKFYIHDMGKGNIDNDNKWPWQKFFKDCLTETGIIPDDNVYIANDDRKKTILIPEDQEQKMEIIVYGQE